MTDIPPKFGIHPECIPETENIKEVSAKNPVKKITKFYYTCKVCQHSSQNKISMLTHTCQCLKIKLICQVCSKEYESADYAKKHIKEAHRAVLGIVQFFTASTFLGSVSIPLAETIWPKYVILVLKNSHLLGFNFRSALSNLANTPLSL